MKYGTHCWSLAAAWCAQELASLFLSTACLCFVAMLGECLATTHHLHNHKP
jgi:hypothetical protein